MTKKQILVTGAAGYIWSHGVVAFEQASYKTVLVDNFSNSWDVNLHGITQILWYTPDFHELDLRDKSALVNLFKNYDFDWVIHFAGLKSVWESCLNPSLYFDNNIVGSICLFECMEKFWVKNIVFSSSATVYDSNNSLPFHEDHSVWNTNNPYGTSKFICEKLLQDMAQYNGCNVVNLRYFNPIWSHKSGLIWEYCDTHPNNLLPYIMKVAWGELNKLQVFWNDYDTIDGSGVRDYIDVNDLMDGHLKWYQQCQWQDGFFETYNLWVGKWVSVLEFITATHQSIWKDIAYDVTVRRPGDTAEVYCDPTKAQQKLNWKTHISLSESIQTSWKYYQYTQLWNK